MKNYKYTSPRYEVIPKVRRFWRCISLRGDIYDNFLNYLRQQDGAHKSAKNSAAEAGLERILLLIA